MATWCRTLRMNCLGGRIAGEAEYFFLGRRYHHVWYFDKSRKVRVSGDAWRKVEADCVGCGCLEM